jgi:uncharacterized protein YndB with AHSA1/START domain
VIQQFQKFESDKMYKMGEIHNNSIAIEATINAPIEKVWQAWTEADKVVKWFGSDPNGSGKAARLDVRPGGSFEVTFNNSDGAEHTCSGVYADVEPFTKLTFSWTWKSEPGVESFVTVLLSPEGNHTRMNFEHANLGSASEHDYLYGWNSTFLKLDRLLRQNEG